MGNISNNTKASFLNFNITEREKVSRDQFLTVQDYSYRFSRNINAYGRAYGASSGGLVTLTVKVGSRDQLTGVYERLNQAFPSSVSFIFNAVFDGDGYLSDYDGGMVLDGYVVNVEEIYNRSSSDENGQQMVIKVDMLMSKVSYLGVNNNLDMVFTS